MRPRRQIHRDEVTPAATTVCVGPSGRCRRQASLQHDVYMTFRGARVQGASAILVML